VFVHERVSLLLKILLSVFYIPRPEWGNLENGEFRVPRLFRTLRRAFNRKSEPKNVNSAPRMNRSQTHNPTQNCHRDSQTPQ